ncbi:MAG: hypothetical protein ACOCQD_02225, partial [archaeon]
MDANQEHRLFSSLDTVIRELRVISGSGGGPGPGPGGPGPGGSGSGGSGSGGLFGSLVGAAGNTGKALTGMSSAIIDSNARLSTLAHTTGGVVSSLGIFGKHAAAVTGPMAALSNQLGDLLTVVEQGVDTLNKLSTSGASFNNSVLEMKNAAAQSRMNLQDFSYMVQQNTDKFASMGGTVTQGLQSFEQLNRLFYQATDENGRGLANSLVGMGFTVEEINDTLLLHSTLNRRILANERMSKEEAIQSAHKLATEMDVISKLTGADRKEMQQKAAERAMQGDLMATLDDLEDKGVLNARDNTVQALAHFQEKFGDNAARAFAQVLSSGSPIADDTGAVLAFQKHGQEIQQIVSSIKSGQDVSPTLQATEGSMLDKERQYRPYAKFMGRGEVFDVLGQDYAAASKYQAGLMSFGEKGENVSNQELSNRAHAQAQSEQEQREGITNTIRQSELYLKNTSAAVNDFLFSTEKVFNGHAGAIQKLGEGFLPMSDMLEDLQSDHARKMVSEMDGLARGAGDVYQAPIIPHESQEYKDRTDDILTFIKDNHESFSSKHHDEAAKMMYQTIDMNARDVLLSAMGQIADEMEMTVPEVMETMFSEGSGGMAKRFNEQFKETFNEIFAEARENSETGNLDKEIGLFNRRTLTDEDWADKLLNETDLSSIDTARESLRNAPVIGQTSEHSSQHATINSPNTTLDTTNVTFHGIPGRKTGSLGMTGSIMEDFGIGKLTMLHGKEGVITQDQYEQMVKGTNDIAQSSVIAGIKMGVSNRPRGLDSNDLSEYFQTLSEMQDPKSNVNIESNISPNVSIDTKKMVEEGSFDLQSHIKKYLEDSLDFSSFSNELLHMPTDLMKKAEKDFNLLPIVTEIKKSVSNWADSLPVPIDKEKITNDLLDKLRNETKGLDLNSDKEKINSFLLQKFSKEIQFDDKEVSNKIIEHLKNVSKGLDLNTNEISNELVSDLKSKFPHIEFNEDSFREKLLDHIKNKSSTLNVDNETFTNDISNYIKE